jgi:hypothetical protein
MKKHKYEREKEERRERWKEDEVGNQGVETEKK